MEVAWMIRECRMQTEIFREHKTRTHNSCHNYPHPTQSMTPFEALVELKRAFMELLKGFRIISIHKKAHESFESF
jgi:hypothetical protein